MSYRSRAKISPPQRFATEAPTSTPAPVKRKNYVRRFVFYTTAATATFYVGSAFVSFESTQYRNFFADHVPLGTSVVQYAEDHNWDTLTIEKVIQYGVDSAAYIQKLVSGKRDDSPAPNASTMSQEPKERIKGVTKSLKTTVKQAGDEVREKGAKAAAIARHQSVQFSEGVEELVRLAEDAIQGKARQSAQPETKPTPAQPVLVATDAVAPLERKTGEPTSKDLHIYSAPLPVGFEPPPGYAKPKPPKPVEPTQPAPPPLPLVAPAVSEFSSSEPVIAQLASVIDNLASYLGSNPAAAEKARDILDTAQVDLKLLAGRIEEVKEDERRKLEAQLDEQTREYTIKLLELEMEAQDKLDSQESDFRSYFEQEKVKFVEAYREKLNRELQTQSEIINERYV